MVRPKAKPGEDEKYRIVGLRMVLDPRGFRYGASHHSTGVGRAPVEWSVRQRWPYRNPASWGHGRCIWLNCCELPWYASLAIWLLRVRSAHRQEIRAIAHVPFGPPSNFRFKSHGTPFQQTELLRSASSDSVGAVAAGPRGLLRCVSLRSGLPQLLTQSRCVRQDRGGILPTADPTTTSKRATCPLARSLSYA